MIYAYFANKKLINVYIDCRKLLKIVPARGRLEGEDVYAFVGTEKTDITLFNLIEPY